MFDAHTLEEPWHNSHVHAMRASVAEQEQNSSIPEKKKKKKKIELGLLRYYIQWSKL